MNITSVSSLELFRILFNHDPVREINEGYNDKSIEENPPIGEDKRYDRLIILNDSNSHYDELDTTSVTSLYEGKDSRFSKLFAFSYGFSGNDERLTEFFGGIGTRLDNAYSEGTFTETEYNELNAGLNDLIINMKAKCDESRAKMEWTRSGGMAKAFDETFRADYNTEDDSWALLSADEKYKKQMEDYKAKEREGILAFLNAPDFITPIEKIMKMIQAYRTSHAIT
jgi:hypothetical protein